MNSSCPSSSSSSPAPPDLSEDDGCDPWAKRRRRTSGFTADELGLEGGLGCLRGFGRVEGALRRILCDLRGSVGLRCLRG